MCVGSVELVLSVCMCVHVCVRAGMKVAFEPLLINASKVRNFNVHRFRDAAITKILYHNIT